MKLTGSQVAQLNTLLGKTTGLIWEHDRVMPGWYVIRKITVNTDVTGEYESVTLGLFTIADTKWSGEYFIGEVLTKEQVIKYQSFTKDLANYLRCCKWYPEYLEEVFKQEKRLDNLIDTYPGDTAGVKHD